MPLSEFCRQIVRIWFSRSGHPGCIKPLDLLKMLSSTTRALTSAASAASKMALPAVSQQTVIRSKHSLPDLPYDYNALEPVISAEIMTLHHSKHHNTYVTNLNVAEEKLSDAVAKGTERNVCFISLRTICSNVFFLLSNEICKCLTLICKSSGICKKGRSPTKSNNQGDC